MGFKSNEREGNVRENVGAVCCVRKGRLGTEFLDATDPLLTPDEI